MAAGMYREIGICLKDPIQINKTRRRAGVKEGKNMTLKEVQPGQQARVDKVGGDGQLRQHFLDMGVRLHGYELTLRLDDADKIEITQLKAETNDSCVKEEQRKGVDHPGLGEEGKFHPKGSGNPLPEGTLLTFALVGNQNSGKTTLFNQLTGANQHVGNFPGVTVDRKDGPIRGYKGTLITDLPGIYSMSPYSTEELVSRNFVLNHKPKAIINIVDVTNLERNLYLTTQLLELGIPVVIAINMIVRFIGSAYFIFRLRIFQPVFQSSS